MIVLPLCILAMAEGTDRDYMEWLFREHYRLMMATAWRFVRQSYDADEIVSESLMALYRKIDKIRHMKQNSLRLYIISTVRNTSLNYLKKHQRMNSQFFHVSDMVIGQLPSEENLEKKIVLSEELDQVRIAIRQSDGCGNFGDHGYQRRQCQEVYLSRQRTYQTNGLSGGEKR